MEDGSSLFALGDAVAWMSAVAMETDVVSKMRAGVWTAGGAEAETWKPPPLGEIAETASVKPAFTPVIMDDCEGYMVGIVRGGSPERFIGGNWVADG